MEGEELEEHMERQRVINEEKAAAAQAEKRKSRKLAKLSSADPMDIDVDDDDDDDDEDEDEENQVHNKSKSSVTDTIIDTGLIDDAPIHPVQASTGSRLPSQSPFAPKRKAFAMFPYKEDKYVCDDYGEVINPDDYMIVESKTPAVMTDLSSMSFGDSDERQPLSELFDGTNTFPSTTAPSQALIVNPSQHPLIRQVQHQPSAIPFKTIREKRELKILAKVLYIDFEARSDRESIEKLLSQIKPKNLILIHGTQDCIDQLERYCTTKQIVQGRIFSPRVGETVDATTERNLYQVTTDHRPITDHLISLV